LALAIDLLLLRPKVLALLPRHEWGGPVPQGLATSVAFLRADAVLHHAARGVAHDQRRSTLPRPPWSPHVLVPQRLRWL
jgi:hypothetical protein